MIEIKHKLTGEVIYTHGSDSLSDADLRGANLRGANLSGADLSYANLSCANLRYTDLRYTDLRYANLRYANLRGADLRDANLRYTNLSGADLSGADLSYADLSGADLSGVDLSNAHLNRIKTGHRYITIGCIGRENRQTTYCFDTDTVWCGCFTGTLEQFASKVEETHKDNPQYLAEYRVAIAYIKSLQNHK